MTTTEYKLMRELKTRIADLAERLDGQNIGTKPITKQQAAVICYGMSQDLKRALGEVT